MSTIEEIRTSILKASAAEREMSREMAEDVLSTYPDSEFAEYHRNVLSILDTLDSEAGAEDKNLTIGDVAKLANHRREAGQKAGRGIVRMATDKQTRFVRHLLETRDLSQVAPKLQAEVSRAAREVEAGKLSLSLCRDVLDTLTVLPVIEGMEKLDKSLTEKQENLILKLAMEKAGALEMLAEFGINSKDELRMMSKDDATKAIDRLFKMPRKAAATPGSQASPAKPADLEDGVYFYNENIYKVQHAAGGSGRQYAKKLVPDEFGKAHFEYAKGIIFKLTAEHKLTKEQAKQFGSLYGTCCACGRTLSNEDSIDRMMGPICYGKMGW